MIKTRTKKKRIIIIQELYSLQSYYYIFKKIRHYHDPHHFRGLLFTINIVFVICKIYISLGNFQFCWSIRKVIFFYYYIYIHIKKIIRQILLYLRIYMKF